MPRGQLDELARAAPSTLFVVDEAYQPLFDDGDVRPVAPRENVAVLRSLTKVFALPGLRIGYLVASVEVARAVQAVLPPWSVSQPASAAALCALDCDDEAQAARREIARLRAHLIARLGGTPDAQGGTLVLYRVGDAAAVTRRLLDGGCRVRDTSSFGLPAHVRIGVRDEAAHERLADLWRRECK
jgi:histidinol-phosphate/aromatic aminotransferase/cobyric acid decarboxylase-like protein